MYADDTVVYVSDQNLSSINSKLTSDLALLSQWLCANHLTLNVKKTECMYFHSIQKKVNLAAHDPVKLNNVPLTVATSYKYLGVILDS